MPIKQYNSTSQQWEDYNEELVNESVGRCYVNGIYRVAWRGLHAHNGVRFTRWTSTNSLPTTAGNYVLMNDVALTSSWSAPNGETTICLNGYKISYVGTSNREVINVTANSILNVYDCSKSKNNTISLREYNNQLNIINTYTENVGGLITGGRNSGIIVSGVLNLYGGTIGNNTNYDYSNNSYKAGGITLSPNTSGSLNMYGGRIAGNTNDSGSINQITYGGGVCYANTGTLHIYGGKIDHNLAYRGGGIHLAQGQATNDCVIRNCELSHNIAKDNTTGVTTGGGGINIGTSYKGTFSMKNSVMSNNKAPYCLGGGIRINTSSVNIENSQFISNVGLDGGGLAIGANSSVTIMCKNSTLLNNVASRYGGGICLNDNSKTLTLDGVTIESNTANTEGGGIYFINGKITAKNKIIVKDNLQGTSNKERNFYIGSNKVINIIGKLDNDCDIRVSMQNPGKITSGYSTYNEETPDTFFSSDSPSYEVTLDSGEAKLVSV